MTQASGDIRQCNVLTQDAMFRLIVCMMSKSFPPQAGPECFQEFGLDYQPIEVLLHYDIEIIKRLIKSKCIDCVIRNVSMEGRL